MTNLNIAVLVSKSEYNIKGIDISIECGVLPAKIEIVLSNKKCKSIDYCKSKKLKYSLCPWDEKKQSREQYDNSLLRILNNYKIDVVILSEWDHSFTSIFAKHYKKIIKINKVHSPKLNLVNQPKHIFNALVNNRIKSVVASLELINTDPGGRKIINELAIPYKKTLTEEDFNILVDKYENCCLISGLINYINKLNKENEQDVFNNENIVQTSAFKTMRHIGFNMMLIQYTDGETVYNLKRCSIKNKGKFNSLVNQWWFNKSKHIINNHYVWNDGKFMVVKKTRPFRFIFEVHGFLANTLNTKLFDMYTSGEIKIADTDDDKKIYSKLDTPMINIVDKISNKGVSVEDVLKNSELSNKTINNIINICHKLYNLAYSMKDKLGLTLACSQYEFGLDSDNNIILIDDIHSYNNCVYWVNQDLPYDEKDPSIYNMNVIYNWLISHCSDIEKDIPCIPAGIISESTESYHNYILRLYNLDDKTKSPGLNVSIRSDSWTWTTAKNIYLNYNHTNMVCLVTDNKDDSTIKKSIMMFKEANIYTNVFEVSPYKDIIKLIGHIKQHDSYLKKMVWVSLSSDITPLCGIISANSRHPVINCPISMDNRFSLQSLLSTIQQYKDSPVLTILDYNNLPGACSSIFTS
jgi:phosphoribosylaminoimidazole-succinocarboxamide synthase